MQKFSCDEAKITLLSLEQVKHTPHEMLSRKMFQRLCSDSSLGAGIISPFGQVYYCPDIDDIVFGIVPAFEVDNLNAKLGDKIQVGRLTCTVVCDNVVLSDTVVCKYKQGETSDCREISDLKAFIESDEFIERYVK